MPSYSDLSLTEGKARGWEELSEEGVGEGGGLAKVGRAIDGPPFLLSEKLSNLIFVSLAFKREMRYAKLLRMVNTPPR